MANESSAPRPTLPQNSISLFEAWKEYQHVAMHFNDLLMRLRSQSLAAVGALASIAGFAFRGDVAVATRWNALFAAFGALCVFWVAIWVLDFMYYNRLLLGAVKALMAIEEASASGEVTVRKLELSTRIEDVVATGITAPAGRGNWGRWIFYTLVFGVLLAGFGESALRGHILSWPL